MELPRSGGRRERPRARWCGPGPRRVRPARRGSVGGASGRPVPDVIRRAWPVGSRPPRRSRAPGPNRRRVSGITLVPTAMGLLCRAIAPDAWSRKTVGWAMADRFLRAELVPDALGTALGRRRPRGVARHPDPGSQGPLAGLRPALPGGRRTTVDRLGWGHPRRRHGRGLLRQPRARAARPPGIRLAGHRVRLARSASRSRARRTARSRGSAGHGFDGFLLSRAPSFQKSELPGVPARFSLGEARLRLEAFPSPLGSREGWSHLAGDHRGRKFQGVIAATTPTGCLRTRMRLSARRPGMVSPNRPPRPRAESGQRQGTGRGRSPSR